MFGIHQVSKLDAIRFPHLEEGWDRYPVWSRHAYVVAPRWFIRLLEFRDRVCRSWVRHCFDLQLIREGERAPWPRFLEYGWS